jgi:hypothetical protein
MHRLALGLGKTIAELETSLGAAELDDWFSYWSEEPWGSWRDNMHAGLIAAACLGPWIKGQKVTFQDFMLKSREQKAAEDTQQSLDWLMAVGKKVKP